MRIVFAAALLGATSAAVAQTAAVPDSSNARTVEGSWTYAATVSGGEATFRNSAGQPQLWLTCVRASRQVLIARPAAGAAPTLQLWTSNASRNLPAAFNPGTKRISATLAASDTLLDSMALSRGRIAVGIAGQPALVAPAWGEISRVVEECRL